MRQIRAPHSNDRKFFSNEITKWTNQLKLCTTTLGKKIAEIPISIVKESFGLTKDIVGKSDKSEEQSVNSLEKFMQNLLNL